MGFSRGMHHCFDSTPPNITVNKYDVWAVTNTHTHKEKTRITRIKYFHMYLHKMLKMWLAPFLFIWFHYSKEQDKTASYYIYIFASYRIFALWTWTVLKINLQWLCVFAANSNYLIGATLEMLHPTTVLLKVTYQWKWGCRYIGFCNGKSLFPVLTTCGRCRSDQMLIIV